MHWLHACKTGCIVCMVITLSLMWVGEQESGVLGPKTLRGVCLCLLEKNENG